MQSRLVAQRKLRGKRAAVEGGGGGGSGGGGGGSGGGGGEMPKGGAKRRQLQAGGVEDMPISVELVLIVTIRNLYGVT